MGLLLDILKEVPLSAVLREQVKTADKENERLKQRVEELEREVQELRARVSAPDQCPICRSGNLKVISVRPHPQFGIFGHQEQTLKCDNPSCGRAVAIRHKTT